jgi:putative methyltransferase (TIGR04325 family)
MKARIRIPLFRYFKQVLPTDWWRYCRGVYPTFDAAAGALPKNKRVGFDHADIAGVFEVKRIKPSDYAALFWLERLLPSVRTLVDFGGNVGSTYYNFQKYVHYPEDFRWLVCEVPAVAQAGAEMALKRGAPHLGFTSRIQDAEGFDILHTAGTLQFLEGDFSDMLKLLRRPPQHLIINRIPLTEKETFFTIQDSEHTCVPYRVGNRTEFVCSLENLGYSLIDSWHCLESWCAVRFHKSRTVNSYSGFYVSLSP